MTSFQENVRLGHEEYEKIFESLHCKYKGSRNEKLKREINEFFATKATTLFREHKQNSHIMVLDGADLYSSTLLSKKHIPAEYIHVANCSSDVKMAATKTVGPFGSHCTLSPLTAYEFFKSWDRNTPVWSKKQESTKFCAIWLDYCGTFMGCRSSKVCFPASDMDLIFSRQLLTRRSLLGGTWIRDRRTSELQSTQDIEDHVHGTALRYGYQCTKVKKYEYSGMCTLFWNIEYVGQTLKSKQFEVEAILCKRIVQRELQYLVRWQGYSQLHDSWEPISNLVGCRKKIEAHEKKLKNSKPKSAKRKRQE